MQQTTYRFLFITSILALALLAPFFIVNAETVVEIHNECRNGNCVSIQGAGISQCTLNSDCGDDPPPQPDDVPAPNPQQVYCITDQGPPLVTGCNPVDNCSICQAEGLGCHTTPGQNCSPGDDEDDDEDKSIFSCKNPIVPCGTKKNPDGTIANPCNLCYLYNLTSNVVNFCLFCLILPISILALLIGGIFMLASMGNPQMLQTGKTAITNTIVGVIIAFASWLIIATIVNTLGYKGFTAAWNVAPTCKQSLAGTAPPLGGTLSNKFCVKPPVNAGDPASCQDLGSAEECTARCEAGGTCQNSCPGGPPGGGTCTPVPAGPCSESNLSSSCFGSLAPEASRICQGESGGNANKPGDPIRDAKGNLVYRSIGLFQINLSVHSIAGLSCPDAFEGPNRPLKDTASARQLYVKCVQAAENEKTNITKACEIRSARGTWKDWWCTAHKCGYISEPCPIK